MSKVKTDYYPDKVAECLYFLANKCESITDNQQAKDDLTESLYQLKAIAENPYNSDYYRTLWNLLEDITDKYDGGLFNGIRY